MQAHLPLHFFLFTFFHGVFFVVVRHPSGLDVDNITSNLKQVSGISEGAPRKDESNCKDKCDKRPRDLKPNQKCDQEEYDKCGTNQRAEQTASELSFGQRSRSIDNGNVSRIRGTTEDLLEPPSTSREEGPEVLNVLERVKTAGLVEFLKHPFRAPI